MDLILFDSLFKKKEEKLNKAISEQKDQENLPAWLCDEINLFNEMELIRNAFDEIIHKKAAAYEANIFNLKIDLEYQQKRAETYKQRALNAERGLMVDLEKIGLRNRPKHISELMPIAIRSLIRN